MPFFFDGNYGFKIVPIQLPYNEKLNGRQQYDEITVGEYIRKRIRDTHVDMEAAET